MTDTNVLNTFEKVDILLKASYGFPSTDEDKNWYEETNVVYNNYLDGQYIMLDEVPESPDFNTNGTVKTATSIGLSSSDFSNYSHDSSSKSSCSIVDDSTGVVRRFQFLILEQVPGLNTAGSSWYKLNSSDINVLTDTFQFNYKQHESGGNVIQPYLYKVYTQNSLTSTLPFGKMGGNYSIDLKSGVLFFSDFSNFSDETQTNENFQVNTTNNKPVLVIYKYIGRKGIDKLIKFGTSNPSDPVENQLYIDTTSKLLKRYNGSSWDSIGGGGGSTLTAGTGVGIAGNTISIGQAVGTTNNVTFNNIAGTLTTAAQGNITSVGTLTGLTVSGNIAGTLTTAAQGNITSVGTLSSLTVKASAASSFISEIKNSSGTKIGSWYNTADGSGQLYVYNSGGTEKIALNSSGDSHLSGGNLSITGVHNVLMLKAPSRTCVFYYKGTTLKWVTGMNSTTDENFSIDSYEGNDDLILNSSGGNVGIGDSTPSYKLDVSGTGRFTGALTADVTGNLTGSVLTAAQGNITSVGTLSSLTVKASAASSFISEIKNSSGTKIGSWYNTADGSGQLYVYNSGGTEKIALNSSGDSHLSGGNLSITGVHNVLMLKAPSRTCVFYYKGTTLKWVTGMNSTTDENFSIDSYEGNDDLILNSSGGNVGIGTSSPNYLGSSEPTPSAAFTNLSAPGSGKTANIKLDVRGSLELSDANPASPDGSASIPNIYFPASNHQEGNCGLIWRNYHTYGRKIRGAILFEAVKSGYGYSSGGFGFYTSHYQSGYGSSNVLPLCRMTIRGNGDVGVGTENPDYFFHVAGAIAGVSYTTTSDNRLKHNETDIENALDLINKLEVKKYFKSEKMYEKDHHYELDSEGKPITDDKYIVECGLIAQQVKDIPELSYCVEGEEEQKEIIVRDAILRKAKKTPLHLKYQNLFCYNIKATQELDRQQQADKAKIASLETKVASLESELAAIKAHLGL